MYDVTTLLNNKADAASINIAIQNKVGLSEFENLKKAYEKYSREIMNKIDYSKFEAYMTDTRNSLEEIQKDLVMKANIKETLNLLKNKADIDDVNKALTQIHEELDAKCSIEHFNSAMDNQSIINDALCAENCVARWTWKSGVVKNGYAVPWEIQTVNTAPDNFLWEKEKTSVMVVAAGLYEISIGFYADKKPTVQILVNGEPILSAVNSASYVIHHSSGKMKSLGKHTNGNITGINY
jgi:vacuolar-type H+-ATPase catalytic subunit A/Vma1